MAEFDVATVGEAAGLVQVMHSRIRALLPNVRIAGAATTCACFPGDNLSLHVALQVAARGDVIVIGSCPPTMTGLWGGLAATSAKARGIVGVVADGGVRDVAELRRLDFPTWATAVSSKGATKSTFGAVNVPVLCGDVLVHPGDLVLADDDGVVVVPLSDIDAVYEQARARQDREDEMRPQLEAGATPFELLGLGTVLEKLGVRIVGA